MSPARRRKAEDLCRERKRRSDAAGTLRLVDCIQFSDKGQILAKDEVARRLIGFPSRKQGEQAVKAIVSLRDKLAHAQDIVSEDGLSIVELARQLHRILRIGSVFPDSKRSGSRAILIANGFAPDGYLRSFHTRRALACVFVVSYFSWVHAHATSRLDLSMDRAYETEG